MKLTYRRVIIVLAVAILVTLYFLVRAIVG